MQAENTRLLNLLTRRLALLEALSEHLLRWRQEFIASDLEGLERHVVSQEEICCQLRTLDAELMSIRNGGVLAVDDSIRLLIGRLDEAQAEVRQINSGNQALLRRSRQTVNALRNLFQSFELTYSAPAPRVGTIFEERG